MHTFCGLLLNYLLYSLSCCSVVIFRHATDLSRFRYRNGDRLNPFSLRTLIHQTYVRTVAVNNGIFNFPSEDVRRVPIKFTADINSTKSSSGFRRLDFGDPTSIPTSLPTSVPTSIPTSLPTSVPTSIPTSLPTSIPTCRQTMQPTLIPTLQPSRIPSLQPTRVPSLQPSKQPIKRPSLQPRRHPSRQPTKQPLRRY